jgi:hypothetical protein
MRLGIFAREKAEASRIRTIQGLNRQSKQLIKMFSGYEIALYRKSSLELSEE